MSGPLEFEAELEAPPETVWRALTEPALVDAWLAPAQVAPADGGPIECEVLESSPPSRLVIAWRGPGGLDSRVQFTVTPSGAGSHLSIVHLGLAANDAGAVAPLMRAA